MDSSRQPTLTEWLLSSAPLFAQARRAIADRLAYDGAMSLDDLVVSVRLPVRTVLLCLDAMDRAGILAEAPLQRNMVGLRDYHGETEAKVGRFRSSVPKPHSSVYLQLASKRETPALLWGQRRLIPESAVERASYIRDKMGRTEGKIVFLGDDDLVSPLVAASSSRWDVTVIDIDSEVLRSAREVAGTLGANLSTRHADLSQFEPAEYGTFDLAIADPFPSGDGSFERLFWYRAGELLHSDGVLISTLAPSHKPVEYSGGGLAVLAALGFTLFDLQENFGRYETFSFEFTAYEHAIIERLGLSSTIAHTKSLFAAKRGQAEPDGHLESFDFARWTQAAAKHYLTQQAGAENQALLARERGPNHDGALDISPVAHGLDVGCGLPDSVARRVRAATGVREVKELLNNGLREAGVAAKATEVDEVAALWVDNSLDREGGSALGLALRALESWERWRLDDVR
jgi:hypothetical protein